MTLCPRLLFSTTPRDARPRDPREDLYVRRTPIYYRECLSAGKNTRVEKVYAAISSCIGNKITRTRTVDGYGSRGPKSVTRTGSFGRRHAHARASIFGRDGPAKRFDARQFYYTRAKFTRRGSSGGSSSTAVAIVVVVAVVVATIVVVVAIAMERKERTNERVSVRASERSIGRASFLPVSRGIRNC